MQAWGAGGASAAGDRSDDVEGFGAVRDGDGERVVRGDMGEVGATGEEANEGSAAQRSVVADGSAEHGEAGLERIEEGALRDGRRDMECDFAVDACERSQMKWKRDADHGSRREVGSPIAG